MTEFIEFRRYNFYGFPLLSCMPFNHVSHSFDCKAMVLSGAHDSNQSSTVVYLDFWGQVGPFHVQFTRGRDLTKLRCWNVPLPVGPKWDMLGQIIFYFFSYYLILIFMFHKMTYPICMLFMLIFPSLVLYWVGLYVFKMYVIFYIGRLFMIQVK